MSAIPWADSPQATHIWVYVEGRTQSLDNDLADHLSRTFSLSKKQAEQFVNEGALFASDLIGHINALAFVAQLQESISESRIHCGVQVNVRAWRMPKPAQHPLEIGVIDRNGRCAISP